MIDLPYCQYCGYLCPKKWINRNGDFFCCLTHADYVYPESGILYYKATLNDQYVTYNQFKVIYRHIENLRELIKKPCSQCGGSGFIAEHKYANSPLEANMQECPICSPYTPQSSINAIHYKYFIDSHRKGGLLYELIYEQLFGARDQSRTKDHEMMQDVHKEIVSRPWDFV